MTEIKDFNENHIEQAVIIARTNYENEYRENPILPPKPEIPDLNFAKNELGVAAFDGGKMTGYLCCLGPFDNAFGTTNAKGIWSPLHGNGTIDGSRNNLMARMYQEAARKWAAAGVTSHSITFYAHNAPVENQLFRYGFGLRCIDAIRQMAEIDIADDPDLHIAELEYDDFRLVLPLDKLLRNHMKESPAFMRYEPGDEEESRQTKRVIRKDVRYFTADITGKIIAFIKIADGGENFISNSKYMKNICGAYCLPEFRGKGIFQKLLNYVIKKLQDENYRLLGVDFESFNPAANGFWPKYFTEYTHSVVRRIDDRFIV
ncbi:MAG: GNAT family N-acetyltransferase [Treponema sp.]|nr:GNAT family N-acetyltransferase [Treponema sp.]